MEHVPPDNNQLKTQALNQLQSHYKIFLNFQSEVAKAAKLISKEEGMTPTQCSRITKPLSTFNQACLDLHNLLQQSSLPTIIETQRHSLRQELYQIEGSEKMLKQDITTFIQSGHNLCEEDSKAQRAEILRIISILEKKLSRFNQQFFDIFNAITTKNPANTVYTNQLTSTDIEQPKPQPPLPLNVTKPQPTRSLTTQLMHLCKYTILCCWYTLYTIFIAPEKATHRVSDKRVIDQPMDQNTYYDQYKCLDKIIAEATEPTDLTEICIELNFNQDRLQGTNHVEKAHSLALSMYKQRRLDDVEQILRKRLPRHFS